MPDRIGDRYELEGPLGSGGMGTVHAARDVETGRPIRPHGSIQ